MSKQYHDVLPHVNVQCHGIACYIWIITACDSIYFGKAAAVCKVKLLCKSGTQLVLQWMISHRFWTSFLPEFDLACWIRVTEHLLHETIILLFVFRTAKVSGPGVTNGELVELQHVHDAHLSDGTAEQLGPLVHAGRWERKQSDTPATTDCKRKPFEQGCSIRRLRPTSRSRRSVGRSHDIKKNWPAPLKFSL